MKGWYGNSWKHGLASRGIKTIDKKDMSVYNYLSEPFDTYIMKEAEKHFKITDDIATSGFILPNGKMLDFDEGKGTYRFEHTKISEIGVTPREFIELGAIRTSMSLSGQFLYLQFYNPLTESQKRTIARAIKEYSPEVEVAISQDFEWNEDIDAYHSSAKILDFKIGTYPSTIFREIEEAMA